MIFDFLLGACALKKHSYIVRVFSSSLGMSLVYWLNLFKTHCVLFASRCTARRGQVIFHCLPRFELERARNTLAAYAFSKTRTSRNMLNGAGRTHRNRAIVHKQLAGFSDFNAGLIIMERIKMSCKKFFMTQKSSKIPNFDAVYLRMRIIHGFHLF